MLYSSAIYFPNNLKMEALLSSSILMTQQPLRSQLYEFNMEQSHADNIINSSIQEVEIHSRTIDEINHDQYSGNQDRNISKALLTIQLGKSQLNQMQASYHNVDIKHFEDTNETNAILLYIEKQRQQSISMSNKSQRK